MNLSAALAIFDHLPAYERLTERLAAREELPPLDLVKSAWPPAVARLFHFLEKPVILLTGRPESVPIWQQSLEGWLSQGSQVLRFPEPTPLPYERGPWSERSRFGRLTVLLQLMAGQHPLLPDRPDPFLVIASPRAFLQKTLSRRRFFAATRLLRKGQILELEKLLETWLAAGYEAVSVVEAPGQFSRRGGILDIFPAGASWPTRIELFGDEIETLRAFDPSTQRSWDLAETGQDHVMIPPAREAMPEDVQKIGLLLEEMAVGSGGELPSWHDDVSSLVEGALSPHLEFYLPMAYSRPAGLLDFVPADSLVIIDDMQEMTAAVAELHEHAAQIAAEQSSLPPNYPNPLLGWEAFLERLSNLQLLILGSSEQPGQRPALPKLADAFRSGPRFGGQVRPFLLQLRHAKEAGQRTIVVSRQAQRLANLWAEENRAPSLGQGVNGDSLVSSLNQLPAGGTVTFVQGSLAEGFVLERPDSASILPVDDAGNGDGRAASIQPAGQPLLHLLTDAEIFGWNRPAPRRRRQPRPVAPETQFADIQPGDFIVHLEFGIGRFLGLVVRNIGGMEREYLQVQYANSDVLYVPVHQADRLSKWIGPDDRQPELNRLGEKSWKRARSRAQQAIDDLADELLDLYALRETVPGHAFEADSQWQAELEASFPYQETEDQLQAIYEVKGDMERPYPMDRLICGDVGYGKTEVALRAAFKAVMDGKQVAMLVPTTVLAQQHYNTFRQRLKTFPVNIEMLSRFRTQSRQRKILHKVRGGEIDIVIGTHRLLSNDVSFKDLGLLIIDEEQRFGVTHKEKLKQLRTELDVLTMTATPIPRTLYMSLTGVRDISVIDTAPADRLPVQTFVGESNDTLIRRAILRELDRGGQVFYVHNRVQTIQNVYQILGGLVPEASIAIGHGQMSERELESVMVRFVKGEIDVLLSTTIIESGLDIPNANTLIVDRAGQFGLSQLYQLRGRIGRGVRRAYAYFLHRPWHTLTSDAKARLEVIASQTELGAGYNIAMRDLEIRGAGDLLGARQSGHIAAVGFDLYTRLLAQAVKRRRAVRRGEKVPMKLPDAVMIDLPLAAYVPTDYVPDASLRLRLYRRMAVIDEMERIEEMAAELADRFGPIPDPVDNLLYQLRVKVLAMRAHVAAVATEGGQIQIRLPDQEQISRMYLQRFLGHNVRVSRKAIWLGRDLATHEWQVILVQLLEKLQQFERS